MIEITAATPFADRVHAQHLRLGFRSANCVHCDALPYEPAWRRRSREAVASQGYVAVKALV